MSTDIDFPEHEPAPPKIRICLRCQTEFESAWAGERICKACKSTHAWRSGEGVRTVSNRSGGGGKSGGD
ncbi:hypothetical protein [Rhodovibrio salinarum]|uniref:Uncharacterized protein n=1 Tax=Rhodovibrio salinarum TaxID=1087 RepID=A0A934QL90_9PROT|nr:hypothetical protein [Rhodovibrio salinarum]MBK1698956.1 hypothetical protein [Rhodovibrio salinarum]